MDYGRQGQFALPALTPGVKLLLLINGALFVATAVIGRNLPGGATLSHFLGVSWDGLWEYWGLGLVRLCTYQFVHSYESPMHVLFNMLILYFFGTFVEGEVGKRGLIRLYLISGVCGAVCQMLLAWGFGQPEIPTIGASGACYGILVYAAFMAPRMTVIFIIFPIELRWLVGFLVFYGAYETLLTLRGDLGPGGVAHGAHLGGALWGAVAFRYLRRYYMTAAFRPNAAVQWFRRWRADRARLNAAERQATLDALLDKVHREGMSALSGAERRFLERASRDMKRK